MSGYRDFSPVLETLGSSKKFPVTGFSRDLELPRQRIWAACMEFHIKIQNASNTIGF